jgi:hypothetical protein
MNTEDTFYFGKRGQPEKFGLEDACWKGYEAVGTKQKDGKTVPNCVPMKNAAGFAEASASPLLGDLVEKNLLPNGGWRAVEVGGGALIVNFEDGDLAKDFGARASESGYTASQPEVTVGRYWKVEVKNGK